MTRQIYDYDAGLDAAALSSDLAAVAVLGVSRNDAAQEIYVDYHPDATSTELSDGQDICEGSPYNLTLSSSDTAISAEPWTPLDLPGLEIWIDGNHSPHTWQSTAGETAASSTADPIGQIDDPSPSCHIIQSTTSTRRPALQTDGLPESHIRFDPTQNGNTVQLLQVRNSVGGFNFIHQTGIFSVVVKLRVETDLARKHIIDSNTAGTGGPGLHIEVNSLNEILVNVRRDGASATIWNSTTSVLNTITTSDGFVTLAVYSTDGSTLHIEKWDSSGSQVWAQTFSRTNAPGGTANATTDLTVGTLLNSIGSGLNASVQGIAISNVALSSADIVRFARYSPRRSSKSQLRISGRTLTNFCYRFYDFTNTTKLWTDTARTTNVASNGDTIAACDHIGDTSTHLNRGASQSTSGNRPTWRSTSLGAEWDGSNDTLTLAQASGFEPNGGAQTLCIVAQNRDHTNGSHVVSLSGGVYVALTGDSYSGGGNRWAHHFGAGGSIGVIDATYDNDDNFLVVESRKNGLSAESRTSFNDATADTSSLSTGDTFGPNSIGASGAPGSGWQLDGYELCNIKWLAYMTADEFEMYVRPWIEQKFPGVSLA